eukprot:m.22859 g.22859  ORF g.22859 m.22859 type:complete len:70 (-) comp34418_c0_seq1:306-515(-)
MYDPPPHNSVAPAVFADLVRGLQFLQFAMLLGDSETGTGTDTGTGTGTGTGTAFTTTTTHTTTAPHDTA